MEKRVRKVKFTSCNLDNEQLLSIIIKEIRIFLQNVYKNNLLTNTILEAQRYFDIIFIQEPL